MQRREFNQAAVLALLALAGCGGGGGDGAPPSGGGGEAPLGQDPAPEPGPVIPSNLARMGTNFSGMEWAGNELRRSPRTVPNLDWTAPRAADVTHLAVNGFGRNRLPIQWELLQPMLVDTVANAQAGALIGEPGAFHEGYAQAITRVLDAHAAVGARCVLDCHNYCRYTDFRFQSDGSVIGLSAPDDPQARAYTTDPAQVWTRIFATAPGASLRPAAFVDFWVRAAQRWKDHPGFGGYGLMNEPHELPAPGQVVESPADSRTEDLFIWPAFARAAIDAIRAIDPSGPIYLAGNAWGGAMTLTEEFNPAWPLAGENIVYEVHAYLDAFNNGRGYDWELEVAKNFSAGFGPVPMNLDTGLNRMRIATDFATRHNVPLALSETAMPLDDPRWQEAFRRMIAHCVEHEVEVQSWMGGAHWAIRNHAIHHVPGWHQHRTLEAPVAGPLKEGAGIDIASVFDDTPAGPAQGPQTVTVYVRGHLAQPLTLGVSSDAGGQFSKTALVIPAGPNGQDSYSFTPEPGRVSTLSYTGSDASHGLPPPRRVYSLADPVAHAALNLDQAARAILARYGASLWDMADGHTDFVQGRLANEGEPVRAVADSGFGSSLGNAMEMLNWMNEHTGPLRPPLMRTDGGRRRTDHADASSTGLWCRKWIPGGTFPGARNRVPFRLADPHFVLAAVALPAQPREGVVFLASVAGGDWLAELATAGGRPQARWRDTQGQQVLLQGDALAAGAALVLALRSAPGAQQLRVNGSAVNAASAGLVPAPFEQLQIGWGYVAGQPRPGFGGQVHAVIAGGGAPSEAELQVLERFLAARAGVS